MKDFDLIDVLSFSFFLLGVLMVGILILAMGISLKDQINTKRRCQELSYEEYKIDTRCQELLED